MNTNIYSRDLVQVILMVSLSLSICLPASTAEKTLTAAERTQRQQCAADFSTELHKHGASWARSVDGDATLTLQSVGQLLEDPSLDPHEAAALAAILRRMRYKKLQSVALSTVGGWSNDIAELYGNTCKAIERGNSLYGPSDHPVLSELQQGGLGDCFLISSINAILCRDPQKIMNLIEPGRSRNEYIVNFPGYSQSIKVRLTPGEVASLPNSDGDNGVWLPILVTADSAIRNGGEVPKVPYIDMSGGHPGKTLQILTGLKYTHTAIRKCTPRMIKGILGRAEDGNYPVGINTPEHDCCVISYDRQNEIATIKNPWGTDGPYHFRNGYTVHMDKGQFKLTVDQLMSCFSGISYPERLLRAPRS